jgi:hypothetical protein
MEGAFAAVGGGRAGLAAVARGATPDKARRALDWVLGEPADSGPA